MHAGLVIFCGCAPRGHLVPRDVSMGLELACSGPPSCVEL